MKILITNHWFKRYGGSETFTYTLGKELKRLGHQVHLFTHVKGPLSKRMNQEGIPCQLDDSYDLILANHNSCVEVVHDRGFTIQTCHGTTPQLEQPSNLAHRHVSISEEVKAHLSTLGFESQVIYNGIDLDRFQSKKPLNKTLKRVLSLCHSDEANTMLHEACKLLQVELTTLNKYKNGVFHVENHINEADLVVSIGRGVYEAMACGRPVVIFDKRSYQPALGDGYLVDWLFEPFIHHNCSGRSMEQIFTPELLQTEMEYYDASHGSAMRNLALKHLDIKKQVDRYLQIEGSY